MNSKFKIEPVFVWPQINKKRHAYWRLRRCKRRILEQVGVE